MDLMEKLYLEQIEDYCNVKFNEENIPAGVALAIAELVKTNPSNYLISSESLSDMSISYANPQGTIPQYIINWLQPYRRPHIVGNKEKREYNGGSR